MRKIFIFAALSILSLGFSATRSRADVDVGVSIGDDGIKGFYLAIGDHYQVPQKQVLIVRERNIPDEELPVVFFLAKRAGVAPGVIIDLRLKDKSWMAITLHFGLSAEIFYVPVSVDPGPPYGKAYGHFRKRARNKWGEIRLADADVINLVNLRFISERHGYSPDEVIKIRQQGKNFVAINTEVKARKDKQRKKQFAADKGSEGDRKASKGKTKESRGKDKKP
ncbi:MAG TPA: hypothetical protein VMY05_10680 [Acidobacteriota bacterium]|nr:hypothetical protein [Acidobacteriota bacterium]